MIEKILYCKKNERNKGDKKKGIENPSRKPKTSKQIGKQQSLKYKQNYSQM